MLGQVDWSKTKAYSPPHTSVYGTIYINLEGRQGQGSVPQRSYEETREQIIQELKGMSATTPNLQVQVFRREELYREKYLLQAPDLIYVINNWRCISRSSFVEGAFFQKQLPREDYSGTHRPEGILIVRGPEIRKGHRLGQAGIIDIAPTLLHILEIPIPQDMDGKVLKDLFEPNSPIAQRKIQFAAPPERAGSVGQEHVLDKTVRKQLEDLGYL
jgi:predicted AlkP superfamily phosphohydrolase/phosphomutase